MIIAIIIGVAIGCFIMWCILNPQRIKIIESNRDVEIENAKAKENLRLTLEQIDYNNNQIKELNNEMKKASEEVLCIQNTVDIKVKQYEQSQMDTAKKNIELSQNKWLEETLKLRKEIIDDYISQEKQHQASIEEIELAKAKRIAMLNSLSAQVKAVVDANKRAEELKNKTDFYRLQLSPEDVEEIKMLRTIEPHFRDASPLNKVIYKVYYENQYSALVGRIFGDRKKVSGIYKITNIENGMSYVGQSVDVRERWRQHIKCGVGADTPSKNKLYPALKSIGVENFTFELLEECSQEQLDEKEKFYIDLYKALEYGYNSTKGNG